MKSSDVVFLQSDLKAMQAAHIREVAEIQAQLKVLVARLDTLRSVISTGCHGASVRLHFLQDSMTQEEQTDQF